MADFRVDPQIMLQTADKLNTWCNDYSACVNRIYQVAQDLPQGWGGAAQASYINQLAEFQNDFQGLYNLFTKYIEYLKNSAHNYINVEEDIAAAAKNLQIGN